MRSIIMGKTDVSPTNIELNNRALARKAAAEGFVLLENDGVLPLKDSHIALYGSGARMTVKGGTGSGAVRERYSVTIAQGLENAGFHITSKSWLDRFDRFYTDTYEAYRIEQEKNVEGLKEFHKITRAVKPFEHPTGIPVTQKDVDDSMCDTAIYILARQAGEGHDRFYKKGDYLLDDIEEQNLEYLSKNYKNFIVVINVGGIIDISFMDKLHVSALIYFAQGGEEGGNALADVLSGAKNFSGKLTTSWAYHFEDLPSSKNYSYLGEDKYNQDYQEGIYVGYRYFDTFGIKPRYHFGYGLSYTSFRIEGKEVSGENGKITLHARVTNTGAMKGREVVQLYATIPFGEGCEKQRLVAFAKTKDLAPGEEEIVTLAFSAKDLAAYDEGKSAWLLKEGDYVLRLGNASHTAAAYALLTLSGERILEQCVNICPLSHPLNELVPPPRETEDYSCLPVLKLDDHVPETVVHSYDRPEEELDPLVEQMTPSQLATLVVGGGTSARNLQVYALGASGTTSPGLYGELGIPNAILSDGPAGLNLTPQVVELPDGGIKAAKVPEVLEGYKRYLFGFNKTVLMSQMADASEGTVHYQYTTAWPCPQLLAQSFDVELLEQVGDGVGQEMEAFGVTVWLAPGMNVHRNPLCGRTFEYYSEDPLVSGKMAAAIVRGVQSHPGKGMSVKHFAANNCELERNMSSSNMTERTLRELYLRGFEIAVKESDPMTVMAAYNKINGVYCTNNYDLLVKVLRNEWGFDGLVMSDWDAMKASPDDCTVPLSSDVQKAHKAQCDLVMPGLPMQVEALLKGIDTGNVLLSDLRRSANRILKLIRSNTVLNSR